MNHYYHIKPKNNGTHVYGVNDYGCFFLIYKASTEYMKYALIFKTEAAAKCYIFAHEYLRDCEPESFYSSYSIEEIKDGKFDNINVLENVICPLCGANLKHMCTSQVNGILESIYHCTNEDVCGNDFEVTQTIDGMFLNMHRYFFG